MIWTALFYYVFLYFACFVVSTYLWLIKYCKIQRNNFMRSTEELFCFKELFIYSRKQLFSFNELFMHATYYLCIER